MLQVISSQEGSFWLVFLIHFHLLVPTPQVQGRKLSATRKCIQVVIASWNWVAVLYCHGIQLPIFMQKQVDPFLFLTNAMGKTQGLDEGLITPFLDISWIRLLKLWLRKVVGGISQADR